jgi:hypothetical protein
MKKFYLVRAVLRTSWGISRAKARIVVAADPIQAARECFDDLPKGQRTPKVKYPEYFKVWPERDRETFMGEVGAIDVDDAFDEDTSTPLDTIRDMFEAKHVEVRL